MANRSGEFWQGWLLHSRPYRESSLLLDFFTLPHGRISGIAKGVRSSKSGTRRALLQPFTPLQVELKGRSELMTLSQVEAIGACLPLQGEFLLSGLYVNELLVRLLPPHEPEPALFAAYGPLLQQLALRGDLEPALRNFELLLLDSLGYGLQLTHDLQTGEALTAERRYRWSDDGGFVACMPSSDDEMTFTGAVLLALAARDYSDVATRRSAKLLLRQALQKQLGGRELSSRALFRSPGKLPPVAGAS